MLLGMCTHSSSARKISIWNRISYSPFTWLLHSWHGLSNDSVQNDCRTSSKCSRFAKYVEQLRLMIAMLAMVIGFWLMMICFELVSLTDVMRLMDCFEILHQKHGVFPAMPSYAHINCPNNFNYFPLCFTLCRWRWKYNNNKQHTYSARIQTMSPKIFTTLPPHSLRIASYSLAQFRCVLSTYRYAWHFVCFSFGWIENNVGISWGRSHQ